MTSVNEYNISPEEADTAIDKNHSPQKKELSKVVQKSPVKRQSSFHKVVEESLEETVNRIENN